MEEGAFGARFIDFGFEAGRYWTVVQRRAVCPYKQRQLGKCNTLSSPMNKSYVQYAYRNNTLSHTDLNMLKFLPRKLLTSLRRGQHLSYHISSLSPVEHRENTKHSDRLHGTIHMVKWLIDFHHDIVHYHPVSQAGTWIHRNRRLKRSWLNTILRGMRNKWLACLFQMLTWGPCRLGFFARNASSMEISPCCNSTTGHRFTTNLCTCQNSWAVVSWTKVCEEVTVLESRWQQTKISIEFDFEKRSVKCTPNAWCYTSSHSELQNENP